MKIEMGESLLRSYFKDVKGCLITQTNWKVSENWNADDSDSAQLQGIYEKIRSDSDFSDAFKTELAQTLRQAEVDVIGIDADGKVYMAEVAFHEGGLNYGEKNETKDRVVKKLLRAYLAAAKFFPGHTYEILFASPKVNPAIDKIIRECFEILSARFGSPAVHFAYYANEGFRDEILIPTYRRTKVESDTSDLFIRSVRMLDMFALVNEERTASARKNTPGRSHQPSDNAPEIVYKTGERIVEAGTFKEELLRIKSARRIWQYADGRTETDVWDASNFTRESSLSGNIHSTSKFRHWKDNGLVRLILTIKDDCN